MEEGPEDVGTEGISGKETEIDQDWPGASLSDSDDVVDEVFEDDSTESSSDKA